MVRKPLSVPLSETSLRIPLDDLLALPSGAVFTSSDGQASVTLSHEKGGDGQAGVIIAHAQCDSLMLVTEEYLETIRSLRNTIEQMESQAEVVEEPTTNGWKYVLYFMAGLVTGAVLTVITLNFRK